MREKGSSRSFRRRLRLGDEEAPQEPDTHLQETPLPDSRSLFMCTNCGYVLSMHASVGLNMHELPIEHREGASGRIELD